MTHEKHVSSGTRDATTVSQTKVIQKALDDLRGDLRGCWTESAEESASSPAAQSESVEASTVQGLISLAVHLNEEQSKLLREIVEEDPNPIALSVGDGHSGYGLYAWLSEYPDEGGWLIKPLKRHLSENFPKSANAPGASSPKPEPASFLPGPEEGEWKLVNRRTDCFDNGWASIADGAGKIIVDTSESLARTVVSAHNAQLRKATGEQEGEK